MTEQLYGELVTLPMHPGLSAADVEHICDVITAALAWPFPVPAPPQAAPPVRPLPVRGHARRMPPEHAKTILSETTAFARSLLSRSLLRFGMVGSSATLCYLWAGHLLVSWARWPAPAAHGLAGMLALLAASPNVERPGYTRSERSVGNSFDALFKG